MRKSPKAWGRDGLRHFTLSVLLASLTTDDWVALQTGLAPSRRPLWECGQGPPGLSLMIPCSWSASAPTPTTPNLSGHKRCDRCPERLAHLSLPSCRRMLPLWRNLGFMKSQIRWSQGKARGSMGRPHPMGTDSLMKEDITGPGGQGAKRREYQLSTLSEGRYRPPRPPTKLSFPSWVQTPPSPPHRIARASTLFPYHQPHGQR